MTILVILALFGFILYTPTIVAAMFKVGCTASFGTIGTWAFFLTAFIAMKWMI